MSLPLYRVCLPMSAALNFDLVILPGELEGPGIGKDQRLKSVVSYVSFLFPWL